MSLLHPPKGFPPHLAVIWPLIWVQLLLLRAAVRAAYGKGVQYHWSVTPNGRVFLTSIDWMPGQKKERTFPNPRTTASPPHATGAPLRLSISACSPFSLGLVRGSECTASPEQGVGDEG